MNDADGAPILQGRHEPPDDRLSTAFDFDAIDQGNPLAGIDSEKLVIGAEVLHALVSWWADSQTEQIAARKLWVTCWILRPDLFSEKHQKQFAANRGFTKQALQVYLARLRKIAPGFRAKAGWINESRESLRTKRKRPVVATQPTEGQQAPVQAENSILGAEVKEWRNE